MPFSMKKLGVTTLFLAICLFGMAQDTDGMKTIISKGTQLNGFGSVDLKYSNFVDRPALLIGAQGGVLLDHHFYLGVGAYGLTTRVQFESPEDAALYNLNGGYAGVLLGGVIAPSRVFHIYIPALIGAGSLDITDPNYLISGFTEEVTVESSAFFVVEPGLEIEANITHFFRLGLGGTWRFVEGAELTRLDNNSLSNWSTYISFRFGRF